MKAPLPGKIYSDGPSPRVSGSPCKGTLLPGGVTCDLSVYRAAETWLCISREPRVQRWPAQAWPARAAAAAGAGVWVKHGKVGKVDDDLRESQAGGLHELTLRFTLCVRELMRLCLTVHNRAPCLPPWVGVGDLIH